MAQPYVGEIRLFGFHFPPAGWAPCDGRLLPISENETLFQLIGTTFGGDGQETFRLPDLQGRAPIHFGTSPSGQTYTFGDAAGTEQHTLLVTQLPVHTHPINPATLAPVARCYDGMGNQTTPAGMIPAGSFRDDPLVPAVTNIRAAHVVDLRTRIDTFRQSVGLGGYPYAESPVTVGVTGIKAQHLLELRTALIEACLQAGKPVPGFSAGLVIGQPIRAQHVTELRAAVAAAYGGGARYGTGAPDAFMAAQSVSYTGGATAAVVGASQPHTNLQPYLAINFCISLFGIFPSPT
jgi:microcystin-dependent protein